MVVGLVLGGVLLFNAGGGHGASSGGGNGGTLSKAWSVPPSGKLAVTGGDADVIATWVTPTTVLRIAGRHATAVATATGAVKGSLEPPEPGLVPCGASQSANAQGVGVVLWGKPDGDCTWVTAMNGADGKGLWQASVTPTVPPIHPAAFLDGGVAVVALGDAAAGWDLTSGRRLWQLDSAPTAGCDPMDTSGSGDLLVVEELCDSGAHLVDVGLDAATGKQRWRSPSLPHDEYLDGVLSASPVVLSLQAGKGSELVELTPGADGTARPGPGVPLDTGVEHQPLSGPYRTDAVLGGVVLTDQPPPPGQGGYGQVAAYSLSTGRRLWTADGGADGADAASVVGTRDGRFLVALQVGQTALLAELDPATGRRLATLYSVPEAPEAAASQIFLDAPNGTLVTLPASYLDGPVITAYRKPAGRP